MPPRVKNIASLSILLLLLLHGPSWSHQLPRHPDHQPKDICNDPLHYLAPDTRCQSGRRPVYIMSDQCPARSVCLPDDACPNEPTSETCPDTHPISLLEHAPTSELPNACPRRRRCVQLSCFDDFCRARRRSPTASWRPSLTSRGSCRYLECGCGASEADLLAEGCPSDGAADLLLILQANPTTGCPEKRCISRLPESMQSLLSPPPQATPRASTAATADTSTTREDRSSQAASVSEECSSRLVCPANTSELQVPNPGGGCPLRVCLLPELLTVNGDTDELSSAASNTTLYTNVTSVISSSTVEPTATTTAAENTMTTGTAATSTTVASSAQPEQHLTNSTVQDGHTARTTTASSTVDFV